MIVANTRVIPPVAQPLYRDAYYLYVPKHLCKSRIVNISIISALLGTFEKESFVALVCIVECDDRRYYIHEYDTVTDRVRVWRDSTIFRI
jgi:hypothetical protein